MKAITITSENFEQEVLKSDKPVLIDFYANWCGPCKMLSPVIEKLAEELDYAKVGKINVDEENSLAASFGVMSIPTIVVMKNGKVTNKAVGVQSKDKLISMLG
ncbi:thioredoxin [bacterium]|nr:thioredoxin [bacterium]